MKKFLEVLMDENGQLHISTDFTFADEIENPPKDKKKHAKEMDELFRKTISSVIEEIWGNHNLHISKAIRYLSMAEIIACAQPYDNAEELWSTLMFSYIPQYEKFADNLKKPYGFDPSRVIRPVSIGNPSAFMFPLGTSISIGPKKPS